MTGNTTQGAFWWAGGADRVNINCEAGNVRRSISLDTPALASDSIRGLTAEAITIEDNVAITGNLTVNGNISASISNPFWAAGRFNGSTLNIVASSDRSNFNVSVCLALLLECIE